MKTPGVILLYRATCTKCRALSLVVVSLSLGSVRRVPLSSPEASTLYEAHSMRPGKFALVGHRRMFTGWRAFPGLVALAVLAIRSRLSKTRT